MNKEIGERWIAALRSGEYQQGQSYLNVNGKFCCLGVLCDLAVKEGVVDREQWGNYVLYGSDEEGWDGALLPNGVKRWAGMATNNGDCPHAQDTLVSLNDGGASFVEISRVIEREMEHL